MSLTAATVKRVFENNSLILDRGKEEALRGCGNESFKGGVEGLGDLMG